jgi:hypothetical protein
MNPVSARRIQIAEDFGLVNVDVIAEVCRIAGVSFPVACALYQQESGGRNVYGHDVGGALSGYPHPVNLHNWRVFKWLVIDHGYQSNGVGPSQITYAGAAKNGKRDGGFFREMEEQGLRPWVVHDNMLFGLQLLKKHYDATGNWVDAGERYNGAHQYGLDLAQKIEEWRKRFRP